MKFTLSWLQQHLETQASLDEIVEALTRVGLEVEGVENPGEKLAAFRVAKVLTAAPHPQADKLQVLTVDTGEGELQVVCGAPNARAGLVGVFGSAGAVVPANGMVLKVAAIRGVESNGMMCSTRELELGDDHDGIIELPADAPVGTAFPDYAGLNDPVIDVSITPNRQDCMGVRGIARDLAAAGLGTLKPLAVEPVAGEGAGPDVRTDDAEGCPAFFGQQVSGVVNGEAPEWMRRRLTAIGQKPISAPSVSPTRTIHCSCICGTVSTAAPRIRAAISSASSTARWRAWLATMTRARTTRCFWKSQRACASTRTTRPPRSLRPATRSPQWNGARWSRTASKRSKHGQSPRRVP